MTADPFALLALMATLACGAEITRPSRQPTASGPGSTDGRPAAEAQPIDKTAPAPDPQPEDDLLTPDGWGPLRIGMSRSEVVAAAGEDADLDAVGGPEPNRCDEFRPGNAPPGVLVMIEEDVLTRITVSRNSDIRTPDGFKVGDSGDAVIAKHGTRARVERHQYWQSPARYITIWRAPSAEAERRGIRYEISPDNEIVHIRAGRSSIEYVEGCL